MAKVLTQKCEGCDIVFTPKVTWQRFHNNACRMKAFQKGRIEKAVEIGVAAALKSMERGA